MSEREDFEIYEFIRNDKTWYGFKVDYIGRWVAPSMSQILAIQKKAREYVKAKLEWVERENKKYYARLAEEERQRALLFKQAKQKEKRLDSYINNYGKGLTIQQKRERSKKIYELIAKGATNEEITLITGAPPQSIARLRYEAAKK